MAETNDPGKRLSLFKQRRFKLAVLAAVLVAIGVVLFLFSHPETLTQNNARQTGTIEIYTKPQKATIFLDGKKRSEHSDTKFIASLGKHTIKLQLAGYDDATIPITVSTANPAIIQQVFTKDGQTVLATPKPGEAALKTYKNDKYGYTIQYPSTWQYDATSADVVNFSDPNRPGPKTQGLVPLVGRAQAAGEEETALSILTLANPNNLGPKEWYEARDEFKAEDQSLIKQQLVTVNGRPGYQYDTPYGFVPYHIVIVTGKGHAFLLQQIQNSPDRSIFDRILQTFTLL